MRAGERARRGYGTVNRCACDSDEKAGTTVMPLPAHLVESRARTSGSKVALPVRTWATERGGCEWVRLGHKRGWLHGKAASVLDVRWGTFAMAQRAHSRRAARCT